MSQPKIARDAEERGEGICRTCLAPIWNEGGTIGNRKRDTGWSDRIPNGGDSLVCFKAIEYRHVPLTGREADIYDAARAHTEATGVRRYSGGYRAHSGNIIPFGNETVVQEHAAREVAQFTAEDPEGPEYFVATRILSPWVPAEQEGTD